MTQNSDLKATVFTEQPRTPLDVNKFSEDAKGLTEADIAPEPPEPEQPASQSDKAADILQKHLGENDYDRMRVITSLLNNFNYAIQIQARRAFWTIDDWRAFTIALQALDGIGRAKSDQDRLTHLDQDVQDTVRMFGRRT